jgi:hypothetical protein
MSTSTDLYAQDFYAWTQAQARLLDARQLEALDIPHLVEEISALGQSQRNELESRLEVLLTHLLKWRYCPTPPEPRRGWRLTIHEQRRRLSRLLQQNPSLRPTVPVVLSESFPHARLMALDEMDLRSTTVPRTCPWSVEQVLDTEFWPEA